MVIKPLQIVVVVFKLLLNFYLKGFVLVLRLVVTFIDYMFELVPLLLSFAQIQTAFEQFRLYATVVMIFDFQST